MGAIDDELNRLNQIETDRARRSERPPGNYDVLVLDPPPQSVAELFSELVERLPAGAFDTLAYKVGTGANAELFLPREKAASASLARSIVRRGLADSRRAVRQGRRDWQRQRHYRQRH